MGLRQWLRSIRIRREHRLLTQAMRRTPAPAVPDGLKDRLIADAMSGVPAVGPRRATRRWAWVGLAPVAATLLLGVWVLLSRPSAPVARSNVVIRPNVDGPPHHVVQPRQRSVLAPEVRRQSAVQSPKSIARHPALSMRFAAHTHRHVRRIPVVTAKADQSMKVVITHSRPAGTTYARAAAWNTDENGERVRTEWTLVEEADGAQMRKLTVTDQSGQTRSVTVAVAPRADSEEPKGEQL